MTEHPNIDPEMQREIEFHLGRIKHFAQTKYVKFTSCVTCYKFDEPSEMCKPANARPPARVIAFGCAAWDGEIPF